MFCSKYLGNFDEIILRVKRSSGVISAISAIPKPGQGWPDAELERVGKVEPFPFKDFNDYDRALKTTNGLQIQFYNFIADDS